MSVFKNEHCLQCYEALHIILPWYMSLWAISSKKRPVAEAPTEAARVAAISAMQHESTLKNVS